VLVRELRRHVAVTSLEELVQAVPEGWRCAAKLQRARVRSGALVERHGLRSYQGGRYVRAFDSLIAAVEAGLGHGHGPRVDRDEVRTLIRLIRVERMTPGEGEALVLLRWLAVQAGVIPDAA
jgi:hypothetical protein